MPQSRKIRILGNYGDVERETLLDGSETWVCNFWNEIWIKKGFKTPARVYEIHDKKFLSKDSSDTPERRARWKADSESAQLVCMDSWGFTRERLFELEKARGEYGPEWFGSSLCYMFWDIMREADVDAVEILAVRMECHGEYIYQVPSMLMWLDELRDWLRIPVRWEYEAMMRVRPPNVRFEEIKDVAMDYGSSTPRKFARIEQVPITKDRITF